MYENAQFAIKYCFLILRNVYSSKKCVESEMHLISLKNMMACAAAIFGKCPNICVITFNLHVARMTFVSCFSLMLLYAGSKTRTRTGVGPLVDDKGNVVVNDKVTAEMFNAYVALVFTKEIEVVPDAANMCSNKQEVLKTLDLSPQKVMKVLMHLNPNKSPGVDQIYSVMLKNLAKELAIPLSQIFECSMATGVVPEDWRIANVAIIHKKRSQEGMWEL